MGKSALLWATLRGDNIIINFLLRASTNANLLNFRGFAALSKVVKLDSATYVKLLLDANTNIYYCCQSGISAIHYAARYTNT